jgi:hypothetical protein
MKRRHCAVLFLLVSIVVAFVCARSWQALPPEEPVYSGKRLSAWLDELCALGFDELANPMTPPALAVRVIGTNAIPWLLSDITKRGNSFAVSVNYWVLERQSLTKYRFQDGSERWRRAGSGFWALGPAAEPAIPDLMRLLEDRTDVVTFALSGIGTPALPALQRCLNKAQALACSDGSRVVIPGMAIGDIYNAMTAGRISKKEAVTFLPAIRAWAQSTNKHAAT